MNLIIYTSDDGKTRLDLRVDAGTVWLSQIELAERFQITKQNVSLHANNILEEGGLSTEATVKESLTVQSEGNRDVKRKITFYNLDLILAIGYRVRSPRGTQFRQWATANLCEYLVKGCVMGFRVGNDVVPEEWKKRSRFRESSDIRKRLRLGNPNGIQKRLRLGKPSDIVAQLSKLIAKTTGFLSSVFLIEGV